MAMSVEERKQKLMERMAALQEQMKKIDNGEPTTRGRAPNPMGTAEDLKALVRQINSLKNVEGLTYFALAAAIHDFMEEGTSTEDLAEMSKKGQDILDNFPKSARGRKAAETEEA